MKLLRTAAAVVTVAVAITGAVAVHHNLTPAGATVIGAGRQAPASATTQPAAQAATTAQPVTTQSATTTPATATTATATAATATAATAAATPATTPKAPAATAPATAPAATAPTQAVATIPQPVATTAVPSADPSVIGAKALAKISYPWTKLGYQLTFHGPKDGFYGLTNCTTHQIDVYITPSQTVTQVAYITAFEIAHAVDCAHISAARQAEWPALRGYQIHGSWFPNCSCSENAFSSGDFAEVFARWQVGPVYAWRSILAPAPTAAQIAALVPFLEG